jgi:adenylate cyclase
MASERLAVMFVDVCDSTTIYESLGDARALEVINGLFATLGAKVKAHHGKIVKTLGDGMVCEFGDADSAFNAACDMQEAAAAAEMPEGLPLAVKLAFNWGAVVTEGGDVFGDTVNVCARLVGLAGADQVLTTQETLAALSEPLRGRSRALYPVKVRGRMEEVKVCEVLWRTDPDVTEAFARPQLNATARDSILKISYAGAVVALDLAGSLRLGRDKGNDVVVSSARASRVHARIYGRGGNFLIADQSSNGTYLAIEGSTRELTLRREEALLGERGVIGLGGPASESGDHVLRYRLERK